MNLLMYRSYDGREGLAVLVLPLDLFPDASLVRRIVVLSCRVYVFLALMNNIHAIQ